MRFFLSQILLVTLISCSSKSSSNSDKINSPKTIIENTKKNTIILVDTGNKPIFLPIVQDTIRKTVDSLSFLPVEMKIFSEANFQGQSQSFYAKPFDIINTSSLNISTIKSIKMPFGMCADIVYNTNLMMPFPFKSLAPPLPPQSIQMTRYYSAKNYPTIDPILTTPVSLTIYPWTDFYLSTDDPVVPAQIEEVFVGLTSNGEKTSYKISGKLSDQRTRYYKSFDYVVPKGRQLHIWESTKNGNAGWEQRMDTSTHTLHINLWVNNNTPLSARNWIGVRASIIK